VVGVRGKERILRGEEDRRTLHKYIGGQHNETHQTLKKNEEKRVGDYNGRGELFKVPTSIELSQWTPLISLMYVK
jgi:hypothetical protein